MPILDRILRLTQDDMMPPRKIIEESSGAVFRQIGEEFLRYFVDLAGLGRHESVLDVGCGPGRMAIPLTKYLDSDARYEGFDIMARQIDWCTKRITRRYPNFRFQLADVYNGVYNAKGKLKASEYTFPFVHGQFDFVFLTSVFTHMLPDDVSHYLSEMCRVLKRAGGRTLMTFFLLNKDSKELIGSGASSLDFKYDFGDWATANRDSNEAAVGYDERFIRDLCQARGLSIRDPIYYGSWCGRKASVTDRYFSYQDIIIAYKSEN